MPPPTVPATTKAPAPGDATATHAMKEDFFADAAHEWQLSAAAGTRLVARRDCGDGWSEVERCADGARGAVPTGFLR